MALTEKELEVQKEYLDTLNTLNCNSKPLIDVLTEVAEENKEFARVIVKCIEDQLDKVSIDLKLPILYLIDSIMKKEQGDPPVFKQLFCSRLHLIFAKTYKEGKDDVRSRLSKLRFTWNGILPSFVLSAIDNEVRKVNPTWLSPAVHVNPKFIPQGSTAAPFVINSMKTENASKMNPPDLTKKEILMKRQELLELQKKSEQLERMKSQKPASADERSDRLLAVANQVFLDVEKLKNSIHNPIEVQKVRETAAVIKNSLLKSLEQPSKDFSQSTHSALNDSIKKLDETIKALSEMEKNPSKRKVVIDKNHFSPVQTTSAGPATKQPVIKTGAVPKAWLSKNSSASPYVYTKPTANGSSAVSPNPPTFRITPVNSQLINAVARRPRDPRLRKIEEQESQSNISNAVPVTKETKVSSTPTPIDTKIDKQNDVSKTKEFVSDTTSAVPVSSSSTTASSTPSTAVLSHLVKSDLKSVAQVDQEYDPRLEKNVTSSKLLQSNHSETVEREESPASKSSVSSTSIIKKDLSSVEPGLPNIESIIPAAPSITIKKPSVCYKKIQPSNKGETKPTKIRVKVVKKGTKERFSKRAAVAPSEFMKPSTSKDDLKEKTIATMTREERQKKLCKFADALVEYDEKRRQVFLENLSKSHSRLAQKLDKLVKKKLTAAITTSTIAEVLLPPPPSVTSRVSPIIIDELMDISDDKNDLIFISGPNESEKQGGATTSTITDLDQPGTAVDVTNKFTNEGETNCAPVPVPMDISEDSEEKTTPPSEKEKSPSPVEEESDKSAVKPAPLMNLSEQLEAVMNASSADSAPSHTQDVDIRSLLPTSIGLNLNCPLPVVSDIIAPTLPVTTDVVPVPSSTAAPFNNPFGLSQIPTKDIDYRQLFRFPLPTIPASSESVAIEELVQVDDKPSSPPRINDSSCSAETDVSVTAPVVIVPPADNKAPVKRKPDDKLFEGAKRRRTISGSSSNGGGSDSESPSVVARSCTPEQHPSELPLPPPPSSLEEILNVPSDSDEETNSIELLDGDSKHAGGNSKREQSSYSLTAVSNDDEQSSDATLIPHMEPRPASKSPPMFPMLKPNPSFSTPNFGMFMSATPEIPEANPDVLKMIRRDPVRSIHIDGISREIRHYGSTAVTFINWDDPRQISFYNGARKIIIDDDIQIQCYLNEPDVERKVYGQYHRFRLGAPTRELYIDGIGYECYFNGSSKRIRIGGQYRMVRLVGDPPRVHIGQKKRQDLVAGKIDIIINEEYTIPVYLDAKPQAIFVDGIPFVLMFIDSLKRVLINDVPFRTAFGGLSQSFKFRNKVYYFRFDILPAGIVPGAVSIFQMIMTKLPSPPPLPPSLQYCDDFPLISAPSSISVPSIPVSSVPSIESKPIIASENPPTELKPPPMNNLLESVNIDELFQKLVASGIVPTPNPNDAENEPPVESKKSFENNVIKFVDFSKPETLKQKQPGLIAKLYSGIQCGSCGLRFPKEQTVKYSQHLDWHFRLNRRGKDGARMIHSRKWYYNSSDWMQFQEMEDNSDRGTSWFESQAATEYTEKEEEEVPCVSAGENAQDAFCILCQDRFEQFYSEDIEEWQLRNALRVDGTLYHPTCYQDHKEKEDNHSDVEEIVDLEEPIPLDDSTPVEETIINILENTEAEAISSVVAGTQVDESDTDSNKIVTINDDSVVIKQEKPDVPKSTEQICESKKSTESSEETDKTTATSEKDAESDEDSDIEEVQLIEQPIEEIIINDDVNDLEPNLETLNVQDIIAVQQEVDLLPTETSEEVEPVEIADKIVDITNVPNVASIDGNIELGDSLQVVNTGTKIKINIAKAAHNEEKAPSPKSPLLSEPEPSIVNNELPEETLVEPSKELNGILAQPLPPGEEPVIAEKKPRLKERKLTEYPMVTKGTETSGLCSIM